MSEDRPEERHPEDDSRYEEDAQRMLALQGKDPTDPVAVADLARTLRELEQGIVEFRLSRPTVPEPEGHEPGPGAPSQPPQGPPKE